MTAEPALPQSVSSSGDIEEGGSKNALLPNRPLVLHVRVVTGGGGGPEKTILNSPRFLVTLGYSCACAYMRSPDDAGFEIIRNRAAEWSAPLLEVDDRGPFDFGIIRRLLKICRDHNVAIWHAHDYKSNVLGLSVRWFWAMKLVTTAHGWGKTTWRTRAYFAIERRTWRAYDKVICVSKELHNQCLAAGVRDDRCIHIPNAIDCAHFRRRLTTMDAKRELGLPTRGVLIGSVGRLSNEKGFDILIKAVDTVRRNGIDVYLAIAGEGDEYDSLARLIRSLGLEERCFLLGFCKDTLKLFQAFDVFALSSHREGLPNVILEAMAIEVPIVATSVGSVSDVLCSNNPVSLVSPGNIRQMAESLTTIVTNSELRIQLAAAGRQRVESHFSFSRRMERVAGVYNELLGATSAADLPSNA